MTGGPARQVAITGVGVVAATGWGRERFWDGLMSGRTFLVPLRHLPPRPFRTRLAGEVPPPPPELRRSLHDRRLSRADRFALAAAWEALAQAGLDTLGEAAGLFFGSSTGGMLEAERFYAAWRRPGRERPRLADLVSQQVGGPAEAVARDLQVRGPVETVASACASGTLALGQALEALRAGEVEVALAGGSDALCALTYAGFNALRSVDEAACLPFRRARAGLSLGEGAAVLVLELPARAAARGARALAVLEGAGCAADAHHMTAPHPEGRGAAAALRQALDDACRQPEEIGSINAHATGTPHNDAAEWKALSGVFGSRAREIPLAATKGAVGHLLGSAGAIEAAAVALSLERRMLPPSPGPAEVDPATPVRLVTGRAEPLAAGAAAVSLNLAFGGCNAALVMGPAGAP